MLVAMKLYRLHQKQKQFTCSPVFRYRKMIERYIESFQLKNQLVACSIGRIDWRHLQQSKPNKTGSISKIRVDILRVQNSRRMHTTAALPIAKSSANRMSSLFTSIQSSNSQHNSLPFLLSLAFKQSVPILLATSRYYLFKK